MKPKTKRGRFERSEKQSKFDNIVAEKKVNFDL